MQAAPRTFLTLFTADAQYEIPVFQRQYVWTKSKQLEPLWDDIRTVADRGLRVAREDPETGISAVDAGRMEGHFLGAIVLDDTTHRIGVNARPVIDGQQRLTTMQLLLSAMREVAIDVGLSNQEKALTEMLFHPEHQIEDAPPHHRFRVWPTLYDRDVFQLVLDTHGPEHVHAGGYGKHRIASAEAFFREQIEAWIAEEGPDARELRLRVLVRVVQRLLRLVVIELDENDNAQLIFETLNARGEDLLAADLVKNFLFQRAEQQRDVDIEELYNEHWRKFEGDVWRKLVGAGRRKRPQIEQFLFHWLTMETTDEVSPDALFPPFRRWMLEGPRDPVTVLETFSRDADHYLSFSNKPLGSVEERFFSRLERLDTNTPIPIVLWLYRLGDAVPVAERLLALRAIESWLVRRALCRDTSRGYNQYFLELLSRIKAERAEDPALRPVPLLLKELAARQDVPSRWWPTDERVRDAMLGRRLYGALNVRRVRMVLRAIEDLLWQRTDGKAEGLALNQTVHVEHLLPQAWEEHWVPASPDGRSAEQHEAWRAEWIAEHGEHRNEVLHSIGNLTLLTEPLNLDVSNGPWVDKRSSIDEFSAFRLNRDIVLRFGADGWDESAIERRSKVLIDAVLEVWPGPSDPQWQIS